MVLTWVRPVIASAATIAVFIPAQAGMTADELRQLEQQLNLFHRRKTGYACAAH